MNMAKISAMRIRRCKGLQLILRVHEGERGMPATGLPPELCELVHRHPKHVQGGRTP